MNSKSIIVFGMHRSGTSMVARLLHELGVNMGTKFREPDEHNPGGYYEDLEWRDLNANILQAAHGTWYKPPRDVNKVAQQFAPPILSLIAQLQGIWGAKDPRFCLTLPVILPHLKNPFLIFVLREKDSIIASLERRAKLRGYYEPREHWENLTYAYWAGAAQIMRQHPLGYLVNYEDVVQDPYRSTVALVEELELDVTEETLWKASKIIKRR